MLWGAALASVLLAGGCTWTGSDGHDHDPANQPGYAAGTAGDSGDAHVVRGDGNASALELVNGADVVRVRVADLGSNRFEVSTPDGSKAAPSVDVHSGQATVGLHDTGKTGLAVVNVVLDDSVRWQVRLAGGATDESVDLSGGAGGDIDFSAGTSRAAVVLPAAKGTQRVTLGGGANQFDVRLAGSAPARVTATGGAGSVTIDGDVHTGVPGGSIWTPSNWSAATDRYDIDATSGVSTLTVARS
jgi:hypothetical protein